MISGFGNLGLRVIDLLVYICGVWSWFGFFFFLICFVGNLVGLKEGGLEFRVIWGEFLGEFGGVSWSSIWEF